jgi:hypothetical protein
LRAAARREGETKFTSKGARDAMAQADYTLNQSQRERERERERKRERERERERKRERWGRYIYTQRTYS